MGKADLHVHTYYSPDAFSSPRKVLQKAKERGLEVLAVTDHNTLQGAREAQKMAGEFGLQVVIGEEITTKDGDVIALFLQEVVKPERTAAETIREIHKQGGIAIAPHPDNWFLGGVPAETLMTIFSELDGIELLNGSWCGGIKQEENIALNESVFGLAAVAGSDSHLAGQVGCCHTLFEGDTPADLYAALKEKSTTPAGSYWTYKDLGLWLLNAPRLVYRCPRLLTVSPLRTLNRIVYNRTKPYIDIR